MIKVEITHGGASVSAADIERAEMAALLSLRTDGIETAVQAAKARQEFLDAVETGGPHGLGELSEPGPWERAQQAASVALTEGWHDPEGADLTLVLA